MEIKIINEVKKIITELQKSDFTIFIVGGSVRDILMDKKPNDWDLTTDATPDEIVKVFEKTEFKIIDISKKHGTIILIINNESYEITTFRIDGDYINNRKPKEVKFTKKIDEDLARRDFTMNALAYSIETGLIDFYNGLKDIENKVIKCVGNPNIRFEEDALRMLRAVRFSAQLDFDIDDNTYNSIKNNINLINNLSIERIREEFNKILISDYPEKGIRSLKELKILELLIPEIEECYEFNQHNINHDKDVFEHTIEVIKNIEKNLVLRLAAFFHDIGKPQSFFMDNDGVGHFYGHDKLSVEITRNILIRMKYSNNIINEVLNLIDTHMVVYRDEFKNSTVKKLMKKVNVENLIKFQIADIKSTANPNKYEHVLRLEKRYKEIIDNKEPIDVKQLKINGYDLIKMGLKSGKLIGEILNELLEMVMEKPKLNEKEKLFEIVKRKWLI